MKLSTITTLLQLASSVLSAPISLANWKRATSENYIRIYSNNIRYAATSLQTGETKWPNRKTLCIDSIQYNARDQTVVGLQEVLNSQLTDIMSGLGSSWSYYGVGRDDGLEAGEYSPIIYKNDQWDLLTSETWWLSETPETPSKGWDANNKRILTYTYLENIDSGYKINVYNTHLDDTGSVARNQSAYLILEKMNSRGNSDQVILLGDFNSITTGAAYKVISTKLTDTYESAKYKYGYNLTFTGFTDSTSDDTRIDFIFSNSSSTTTNTFDILQSKFNGTYLSDHRPLIADITLN